MQFLLDTYLAPQSVHDNKTHCQLCKRLGGPSIPLSWSFLVWKRVSPMDVGSQHPLFCVFGHFWHGDKPTNKQPPDISASLLLTIDKAVFCNFLLAHISMIEPFVVFMRFWGHNVHFSLDVFRKNFARNFCILRCIPIQSSTFSSSALQ